MLATIVLRARNRSYRRICAEEEERDTDADGVPDVYEADEGPVTPTAGLANRPYRAWAAAGRQQPGRCRVVELGDPEASDVIRAAHVVDVHPRAAAEEQVAGLEHPRHRTG
jgi:hypothetical protein